MPGMEHNKHPYIANGVSISKVARKREVKRAAKRRGKAERTVIEFKMMWESAMASVVRR